MRYIIDLASDGSAKLGPSPMTPPPPTYPASHGDPITLQDAHMLQKWAEAQIERLTPQTQPETAMKNPITVSYAVLEAQQAALCEVVKHGVAVEDAVKAHNLE